jgi:hypothetical protein
VGHEPLHGLRLPQWASLLSGRRRFRVIHEGCLVAPFDVSIILVAELIALCDGGLRLFASLLVGGRLLDVLRDLLQSALHWGALGPREVRGDLPSDERLRDGRLSLGHRHLLPFLELLHLHPRGEDLAHERRHVGLRATECYAAATVVEVLVDSFEVRSYLVVRPR